MGKGDDPNCVTITPTGAGIDPVGAGETARGIAAGLIALNPFLDARKATLASEIEAALHLPLLDGHDVVTLWVGGSFSYGLAHDQSDLDVRGVYQAPTGQLLGLRRPAEQLEDKQADVCVFELSKFASLLALKASPNCIELLDSPLLSGDRQFASLLAPFVSQRARKSYGGFAHGQLKMLAKLDDAKRQKPARHLFRLMEQGLHLLQTGQVRTACPDPERTMAMGRLDLEDIQREFDRLDSQLRSTDSVLPEQPDEDALDGLLYGLRLAQLQTRRGH